MSYEISELAFEKLLEKVIELAGELNTLREKHGDLEAMNRTVKADLVRANAALEARNDQIGMLQTKLASLNYDKPGAITPPAPKAMAPAADDMPF